MAYVGCKYIQNNRINKSLIQTAAPFTKGHDAGLLKCMTPEQIVAVISAINK